MLPWMKPKRESILIVKERQPDGDMKEAEPDDAGLVMAAEDLIRAVGSKDAKAVASALRAAFEICDAEPHYEGENLDEESEAE